MGRAIVLSVLVVILGAVGWGWLAHRPPTVHLTETSISAADITLASTNLTLPDDQTRFLPGADGDLLVTTCTACHSPEMILVQPPLAADKWQGEVDKMRKAYKAPIDPKQDAAIVAALLGVQASQGKVAKK